MKRIILFFLLVTFSSDLMIAQQNTYINYNIPLQKIIDSLKLNKAQLKIYVSKAKYILSVTANGKVLKSYPVV
jgi:hypothetical protein